MEESGGVQERGTKFSGPVPFSRTHEPCKIIKSCRQIVQSPPPNQKKHTQKNNSPIKVKRRIDLEPPFKKNKRTCIPSCRTLKKSPVPQSQLFKTGELQYSRKEQERKITLENLFD